MERKIMFLTGETVQVDDAPSHLLVYLPGASPPDLERAKAVLDRWIISGGVLVMGGEQVTLKMASAPLPDECHVVTG